MSAPAGLARVTINAPRRRVDLALPEHVPVAELLPEVLRQAGDGLADEGERHGGWVLRRTDGAPVEARDGLHAQGVRDGEVLHLVPARVDWPQPEYDDVVEAIAAGARHLGRAWDATASRWTGIAVAGIVLGAGLVATGPQWMVAAGVAVLLLAAGTTVARGRADPVTAAALAAYALPYAFAAATAGTASVLAGCAALVLASAVAAAGVGAGLPVFTAGATVGLVGGAGAGLALWLPPHSAAAIVLAVLACGVGAVPLLAIRLGRLPIPLDGRWPAPEPGQVLAAVRRSDQMHTGMLLGHAAATVIASVPLVWTGGLTGRLLVAVSAGVLLLRSRQFVTVRQRLPVLVAGLSALGIAAAALLARTPATAALLAAVAVALAVILAIGRQPSPYLGRAADLLDLVLVGSVVPIACAVLGLYARVHNLT